MPFEFVLCSALLPIGGRSGYIKHINSCTSLASHFSFFTPTIMANSSLDAACNVVADSDFGPGIQCSQFDFTLSFEQAILFLGISASFVFFFPWRTYQLYGTTIKTLNSTFHPLKIASRLKRPSFANF
jgi:hypothetical protein